MGSNDFQSDRGGGANATFTPEVTSNQPAKYCGSKPTIILGSASPRRQELLSLLNISFTICKPQVEERRLDSESAHDYVRRNSRIKAEWVRRNYRSSQGQRAPAAIIISADTVVALGSDVLEKPANSGEAEVMLARLSGVTHQVITGVTIAAGDSPNQKQLTFAVETFVTLKDTISEERRAYIASGEPFDKAGAYGAQGLGAYMVKSIQGSYTNVVGLPLAEVADLLVKDFHLPLY